MLRNDIIYPNKVYHSWSVLARGVFLLPIFGGMIHGATQNKETRLHLAIQLRSSSVQTFTPAEVNIADYLDYWFDSYCKMNLKYNT